MGKQLLRLGGGHPTLCVLLSVESTDGGQLGRDIIDKG